VNGDAELHTLREVFDVEMSRIQICRNRHRRTERDEDPRSTLVGLALSGGGIRSATFALGVLQRLHEMGLLPIFDYLSTVSGGGFIGGWWSAWLSRRGFNASHVRDPVALATKLIADDLAVDPTELRQRLDEVADAGQVGHSSPAEAERALEDALVAQLNRIRERPNLGEHPLFQRDDRDRHRDTGSVIVSRLAAATRDDVLRRHADLLFKRYPGELPRVFPRAERVETHRASDYRAADRIAEGTQEASADPIHHVRLFANYLTPRKGLLSQDTWRAMAVASRNLVLTWLVLVPVLGAALLAVQLYFVVQSFSSKVATDFLLVANLGDVGTRVWERGAVAVRPLAFLFGQLVVLTAAWMWCNNAGSMSAQFLAVIGIAAILAGFAFAISVPATCAALADCARAWWMGSPMPPSDRVVLVLTIATAVALIVRCLLARPPRQALRAPSPAVGHSPSPGREVGRGGSLRAVISNRVTLYHAYVLRTLVVVGVAVAIAGFAPEAIDYALTIAAGLTVGAVGSALFTVLKAMPAAGHDHRDLGRPSLASRIVFALAPILVLLVLTSVAAWATRGWLVWSSEAPDDVHRLPVLTLVAAVAVGVCLIYAAYDVVADDARWLSIGFPLAVAVLGGLAVILLARMFLTLAWPAALAATSSRLAFAAGVGLCGVALVTAARRTRGRDWRVLSLGGFCLLAVVVLWAIAQLVALDPHRWTPTYAALVLFVISTAWVLIVGWMADPNALALHTFYKSRLIRAYLGASNRERRRSGRDINEPVPGDDVKLKDVDGPAAGGPYHLVNTTLNLVGGHDLVTAQRSAASFVLSSEFCGSSRTGYRKTSDYMGGELTLGAAVATSGAAASPNMGARTPSAALAMLLALFNIRLGLWVPTPDRLHWRKPQARLWPYYLLRESLLQTNDLSSYCYLTDGGHFDNTGLYSLVERGCRFIVLVDNGADPEPCFEDVGEAIRRCRIDFGAEIELDVVGFQKSSGYLVDGGTERHVAEVTLADGKAARVHYAIGKITYAPAHLRELGLSDVLATTGGTIIWIKPALTGDETADVKQYGLQNPVFPQQTTADQWFDESQFESYRALGEQSVTAVFETAVQAARDRAPDAGERPLAELDPPIVEQLFADVAPERRPERGPGWLATLLRVARGLGRKG
jgi:predicted acylesterase/phospholipase RssA